MQSTKKAPARREDGVAPSNEESASTGSPAAQQNPLQQVITTDEGKNTKYNLCSDLWVLAICLPAVLSDLSGLIAFNHFFPFTPRFHFPFDSHMKYLLCFTYIMLFYCAFISSLFISHKLLCFCFRLLFCFTLLTASDRNGGRSSKQREQGKTRDSKWLAHSQDC